MFFSRSRSAIFPLLPLLVFAAITSLPLFVNAQPPGAGPDAEEVALVDKFDADGDGFLNAEERALALESLPRQLGRFGGGPGGRRGPARPAGKPGPKVAIEDAKVYTDEKLYDQTTLRTFFFEFENSEWEQELASFKTTDVEVPAKLTVDGKEYPNVGVSFRGASSFFMIPEGLKRSLNVSIDFMDSEQRLLGYKSLNLLNANGDAAMMSSALYSYLSSQKIATPKVNYVKVVINGESWGVYVSSQQFNKIFLEENYELGKGARWKVHGSPRSVGSGLNYLGEDLEAYKAKYEIKSKDKKKSWKALAKLCRVLNETPAEELEEALDPILDIEGALWFLAVDVATSNSDGYWTRASDYNIFMQEDGKFHILPHDMNEAFLLSHGGGPRGGGGRRGRRGGGGFGGPGGGPPGGGGRGGFGGPGGPPGGGGRGGAGGRGPTLDPLVGLTDRTKPLRSVLLNNPKFQAQYLRNLKEIALMMQWEEVGPRVKEIRELIEAEVLADTRKLTTNEAFKAAVSDEETTATSQGIKAFFEQRSKFLLEHEKIKSIELEKAKQKD